MWPFFSRCLNALSPIPSASPETPCEACDDLSCRFVIEWDWPRNNRPVGAAALTQHGHPGLAQIKAGDENARQI